MWTLNHNPVVSKVNKGPTSVRNNQKSKEANFDSNFHFNLRREGKRKDDLRVWEPVEICQLSAAELKKNWAHQQNLNVFSLMGSCRASADVWFDAPSLQLGWRGNFGTNSKRSTRSLYKKKKKKSCWLWLASLGCLTICLSPILDHFGCREIRKLKWN